MIAKLFRDNDQKLFQVVVDSLWNLRRLNYFETDVEEYLDEIIERGPFECYFCDHKIGPGHYMPVTLIVIEAIDDFTISSVCGECTDAYNVEQKLHDMMKAIPGMAMLGEIYPRVGLA